MTQINLYRLTTIPFIRAFPKLLESVTKGGYRVQVLCSSIEEINNLDTVLWTYSSLSFLPHATQNDNYKDDQPIYLTLDQYDNPNGSKILFCIKKMPNNINEYEKLFYMYDAAEEDSIEVSNHLSMLKNMQIPVILVEENKGIWKVN